VQYRKKSIYLLPNLLTTACLFSGFYSMVMAVNGNYEKAAIAIFVAAVLDGLDGRMARLTNSTSDFGAQYDSLADLVSFGVAPALFGYIWLLNEMGKLGWLAAFLFVAAAALRLARFNILQARGNSNFFHGLPCPAAATLVASFIWVTLEYGESSWFLLNESSLVSGLWAVFVASGLFMVSNFPYYSFKEAKFRRSVPFLVIFLIVLGFVLVSQDPPVIFFLVSLTYSLSGIFLFFLFKMKRYVFYIIGKNYQDHRKVKVGKLND